MMGLDRSKDIPSMNRWLKEAKESPQSPMIGMYLTHNGVVRSTPKSVVREDGNQECKVKGMIFNYDAQKAKAAIDDILGLEGIYYVKVWMASGKLEVGDDIMYVLIGGDIRPRVVDALQLLVERLKSECVKETEIF